MTIYPIARGGGNSESIFLLKNIWVWLSIKYYGAKNHLLKTMLSVPSDTKTTIIVMSQCNVILLVSIKYDTCRKFFIPYQPDNIIYELFSMQYLSAYILNNSVNTGFDPQQMIYQKVLVFLTMKVTFGTYYIKDNQWACYLRSYNGIKKINHKNMEKPLALILKVW